MHRPVRWGRGGMGGNGCCCGGGGGSVAWALTGTWPCSPVGGKSGMSICEALDKLCPVCGIGGFLNPLFQGAKIIDCDFWNFRE